MTQLPVLNYSSTEDSHNYEKGKCELFTFIVSELHNPLLDYFEECWLKDVDTINREEECQCLVLISGTVTKCLIRLFINQIIIHNIFKPYLLYLDCKMLKVSIKIYTKHFW